MLHRLMLFVAGVAGFSLLVGCAASHHSTVKNQQASIDIRPASDCDLCSSVDNIIYFDFSSAVLRKNAQATLVKQADWIKKYPKVRIQTAGNCDERGTEEYNLALGYRRAYADRDYLIAHGIAADHISVISYGKERPIAVGSNEQAWAKNRNAISAVK